MLKKHIVIDTSALLASIEDSMTISIFHKSFVLHTTDIALSKFKNGWYRDVITTFSNNGILMVRQYSAEELSSLIEKYKRFSSQTNLNFSEWSVIQHAQELCYPLITNDKELYTIAIKFIKAYELPQYYNLNTISYEIIT